MSFIEGSYVNQRGQKLYYRQWATPAEPKAALIFHHGYGSHCGAYDDQFRRMAESGIALFLYDAHGFGRSEPKSPRERSLVWKWQDLVDDLYQFRKEVVEPWLQENRVPVFLGGLSMGGMTAILAALRQQTSWQGLVVLSPAVDCPRNFTLTIMSSLQSLLVKIVPRARVVPQPVIPNVTLNAEEREKLAKDEFFDPLKVRIQTGAMFLHAWNHIAKHERELQLPILCHYSTIDKIVHPASTERFIQNVQSTDVTVRPFDKHAHDIYLDDCKVESCDLVIAWILSHSLTPATIPSGQAGERQEPAKL